jgi:hypothetical protein
MKKLLIIAVNILLGTYSIYGQGDLNEQQKVFFRNERSLGILINTDGYGASFRGANRINFLNKRIIEIDLGVLKNPKEFRQASYYQQGGSFIFGKLNFPFYIRAGIGRQHELYKKADLGGIAIRYFYSAGPLLSLYKPVYYRVIYSAPNNGYVIKEEKFNTSISLPQEIYSRAPFFKGFSEMKVMPGLYAKAGFNFEYSKEDKVIHAIELGGVINVFPKEIPIMAGSNNKSLFFSLFVSYRFGMILDPLNPDANSFSNLFHKKKNN